MRDDNRRHTDGGQSSPCYVSLAMPAPRVLIVDLNNFARYPSIAIGILVAVLREAGIDVTVHSPLSTGVRGVPREPRARPWSLLEQRVRYRTAVSESRVVRRTRQWASRFVAPDLARQQQKVASEFERLIQRDSRDDGAPFDVVLISTYLMYEPLCRLLCERAAEAGVPVLLGGPYFAAQDVQREWLDIPGMTALITGEVEDQLPAIVRAAAAKEDLHGFAGVVPTGEGAQPQPPPPPLDNLDALPFPDYTDFPAHLYPNVIIPIITGRGCSWGACTFCSDVTSTAGRTFRSRSVESVLEELRFQSQRHDAHLFTFTDLKLNSNIEMWRALIQRPWTLGREPKWICSVHVNAKRENGLSAHELRDARRAGMVRVTTGLESGSQRMLDFMRKGTDLARTSQFLRDATHAGISVRTTMILGYPGEEASDVRASAEFLRRHSDCIDRVSLNRFQIMTGTPFHRMMERTNGNANGNGCRTTAMPGLTVLTVNHRVAQIEHRLSVTRDAAYRRAVNELLAEVHAINRRELVADARNFDGVM